MIPFYDIVEKLEMNRDRFNENYSYVNSANSSKRALLIAFSVLTGVFFVITVLAIVFYIKRRKVESLPSAEAKFNQETENDEDKKYAKLMQ